MIGPEDLKVLADPSLDSAQVMILLARAVKSQDADEVERAVTSAHHVGLQHEFVPALLELLAQTSHYRHEDIVGALQELKDPRATQGLYRAAVTQHPYLDYDEFFGLARKCTWALADIGTDEAREKLQLLARSDNPPIAKYAQKRIDKWENEKQRKRA